MSVFQPEVAWRCGLGSKLWASCACLEKARWSPTNACGSTLSSLLIATRRRRKSSNFAALWAMSAGWVRIPMRDSLLDVVSGCRQPVLWALPRCSVLGMTPGGMEAKTSGSRVARCQPHRTKSRARESFAEFADHETGFWGTRRLLGDNHRRSRRSSLRAEGATGAGRRFFPSATEGATILAN